MFNFLINPIFLTYIIIFFIIIAIIIGFFVLRRLKKDNLGLMLGMSLFLIKIPRYEKKDKNESIELKHLLGISAQMYASFNILPKRAKIIFEVASSYNEEEIAFYGACPKNFVNEFKKVIHGAYQNAKIEQVENDYSIFSSKGKSAGAYIILEKRNFMPIRTYHDFENDPLNQVISAIGKLNIGNGAALQIVLRPVKKNWYKGAKSTLFNLKTGKKQDIIKIWEKTINDVVGVGSKQNKEKKEEPIDQEQIEAISKKISRPVFNVNIRIIANALTEIEADQILDQMLQQFSQYSLPNQNGLQIKKVIGYKLKKLIYNFIFRIFEKKTTISLNADEIASIFHFPYPGLEVPNVKSVSSRDVAPPNILPNKGELEIGKVVYREENQKVFLKNSDDRMRHFYIIGQTGTGKSRFQQELIKQDILAGRGVGVVDPHGDLIEATLTNIPKERYSDVILFEPFNTENPMGLNMLEYETEDQKDFAIQEMIAIFYKLVTDPAMIGPMFEHYMRNAMLALMADGNNIGTMVEIPRLLTDNEFAETYISKLTDPVALNFWRNEWKKTSEQQKGDMFGYLISKVGRFVENPMMRNIIGQSHSSFNLSNIMNQGKIFLANLSKGKVGDMNSNLLGLILVSKIQMAAMTRANMKEKDRRDFYLYIDEFQNFTTDSIAIILSEARKYRLSLTMTHQYITQLDEKIRNAAFGNVGTIGAFRVSQEDAEILEKQFEPDFSRFDLINLPNRNLIIKLLIDGEITSAFKMKTIDSETGDYSKVDLIRKMSILKYGRDKTDVEREIIKRANL